MVIQLPEWRSWRVSGSGREWEVQRLVLNKKTNAGEWRATNFFPQLEFAIAFAYERALRESGVEALTAADAVGECRRVKDELLRAVKRANAGAYEEKDLI